MPIGQANKRSNVNNPVNVPIDVIAHLIAVDNVYSKVRSSTLQLQYILSSYFAFHKVIYPVYPMAGDVDVKKIKIDHDFRLGPKVARQFPGLPNVDDHLAII